MVVFDTRKGVTLTEALEHPYLSVPQVVTLGPSAPAPFECDSPDAELKKGKSGRLWKEQVSSELEGQSTPIKERDEVDDRDSFRPLVSFRSPPPKTRSRRRDSHEEFGDSVHDTEGSEQLTQASEFHLSTPVFDVEGIDIYCGPETPPLISKRSRSQKKLFCCSSLKEPPQRDRSQIAEDELRGWVSDRRRKDLDHGKFTENELVDLNCGLNEVMRARNWGKDEVIRILTYSGGRGRPHVGARGVWKEIGRYLPWSSIARVNMKTRSILFAGKTGRWDEEETLSLKRLVQEYKHDWVTISSKLGRSNGACARKWGSIKLDELRTRKRGKWTQQEYDNLCQCVREAKATIILDPSRRAGNRKVIDNLRWEPVAVKMGRPANQCSAVWYCRLAPSVGKELYLSEEEREWADEDDKRLLKKMLRLITRYGRIYWPKVFLKNRTVATCKVRFDQMTKHLGDRSDTNVEEQLHMLLRRYAPDLMSKYKVILKE
ncbi:hypothetical protein R1sor_024931 [Riccia sorocarpa]|uniref:Uncharacterized protein n=1 Tax=Riccia sorocarpa TaxID=122646 RepID=A0ABD3GRU5_9MARC